MTRLLVSRATDTGRVRDHNEDAQDYRRIKHRSGDYELLIVADGMGGHARGEVASGLAIATVLEYLGYGAWKSPAQGLERAFLLANERVHAAGGGMGTTLTAVLVNSETMEYWVANVGDSRAYLVQRDTFEPLTSDHSEIAARVDAGQMTREEAQTARGRNVLLRAIGPDARVAVDVDGPRVLLPGERLLLCSDGLHTMIPERELGLISWQTPLDADAANRLVALANEAGGRDNITAIIAAMEDDAPTVLVPRAAPPRGLPRQLRLVAIAAAVGIPLFAAAVAFALVNSRADPPGGPKKADGGAVNTTTPTFTATATATATSTTTVTPSPTSTATATATPTVLPTPAGIPPARPVAKQTPTPTPTATITPTQTPTPATATPTMTSTVATGTPSATSTATPTKSPSPTPTATTVPGGQPPLQQTEDPTPVLPPVTSTSILTPRPTPAPTTTPTTQPPQTRLPS